jgi:hypothetical protein
MRVQIAANVAEIDEVGKMMFAGKLDLSAVLAQLRRYIVEPESIVDLGFGRTGDATVRIEEPVLVELPAAHIRHTAQGDIVGL